MRCLVLFLSTMATGAFLANSSSASSEDLAETATRFGALQSVTDISLSPSGTKIVYVTPGKKSEESIFVVDLGTDNPPKQIVSFNQPNARLAGCNWANENRIVCNVFSFQKQGDVILGATRYVGIDPSKGKARNITPEGRFGYSFTGQYGGSIIALDVPGKDNRVLMTRRYYKGKSNNTRIFSSKEGLGVDLVDVDSGKSTNTINPNRNAVNYLADERGDVRIMATSDTANSRFAQNEVRYFYRKKESKDWEPLNRLDTSGDLSQGFIPVAVDTALDVVYGFERKDGFQALFTVKLDGSETKKLVLKRDDVDVNRLVRIGRQRRVIGVSYATEARIVEYFDQELEKLASGLNKALPGKPLISILDASEDESKILLAASSDTDPGIIYLYHKGTRRLEELLPVRNELFGREMANMKSVTYPAKDGTQIPGFLTLPLDSDGKNLPAIVLPHGGPGSRDEWGFDWLPQFLAARGYAVLQPNFRGSSGYGQDWYGRNGFKSWKTAVGDVNDAGRWLVSQGIADQKRLGILGWSYGGYAALQSQALDPELFKAVVAIAPVTDLGLLKEESRQFTNFANVRRFVGTGDHIENGSPARHASKFRSPVLLVHGTMDMNTGVGQSRIMKSRLESADKQVEYLEFDGLDHSLQHSQARAIMLRRVGLFFDQNLDQK
ncbi:MAG: S9 family peptidase [Erythrobacter sp.]